MRKYVLVPLAAGFEEIETMTIVDVLRRAGAEVVLAALEGGPCVGSRGVVVVPDATLDDVAGRTGFDAIVLPGGAGAEALAADTRVIALVTRQAAAGRLLGAICAAPKVLARAGILAGRRATSHPVARDELRRAGVDVRDDERVCEDGAIVTSQAPGTALEFAYALVARLYDEAKVAELERGILSAR
jgi:4-methyl-5(b-hydroxyethyl)-thiazole monophosphate biosynthesis